MRKSSWYLSAFVALGLLVGCDDEPSRMIPTAPPAHGSPATYAPAQAAVWPPAATNPSEVLPIVSDEHLFDTVWVIVLDNSGSMETTECSGHDNRMVAGGKAVLAFSKKRPADNFGLVLFTSSYPYARVAVPLDRGTQGAIERVVTSIRPDTQTPLRPAIELAYKEIVKRARAQRGYGSYHIVVVTDGNYNEGGNPAPVVKEIVEKTPIQVHTVGFCTGSSHALNLPGYTSYVSIDNAEALNQALLKIVEVEAEHFTDLSQMK